MKTERKGYISQDGLWRIYAKLYINGEVCSEKFEFIIDSGSGITILSPDIAEDIGIKFETLSAKNQIDIGNSGNCNARELSGIDIILDPVNDDDPLTLCKMYLPDPERWKRANYSLIGQDVLRQFNITTDNKHKTITLTYVGDLTVRISI